MADLSQPRAEAAPDAGVPHTRAGGSRLLALARVLPAGAWIRIGLLFFVLVLLKLVLLFSLSKHIYQIHWRVTAEPESWINYLAFLIFVGLGTYSLLSLANHCREKGVKTVRAANAMVLSLGLLFIFFTLHTGDKNYLYPIMTRTLKWNSLIPYLSLDLFFRAPFLAAWLFGYGFTYYVVARVGKERSTLHLTALVSAAYALLCLRELHYFRNELLVIDCVGLACLWAVVKRVPISVSPSGAASTARNHGLLISTIAPTLWAGLYCLLLKLIAPELRQLDLYFLLLLGGVIVLFAFATVWAKRHNLFSAWIRFTPFFAITFLLLANAYYPMAGNYNNSLCLALEFPHYFLGELGLGLALTACAWVYHRARPKAALWWLDVVSVVLITIAVIDLRVSQIMGVRLEWDVLTFGNSLKMMWRMAKPYLPGLLLGLGTVVLVYVIILRILQRSLNRFATTSASRADNPPAASPLLRGEGRGEGSLSAGLCFAIATFVLLGILGWATADPDKAQGQSMIRLASSSPLWSRVSNRTLNAQDFRKTATQLGLTPFASSHEHPTSGEPSDLNVLVVFMESSYNKYLSLFGSEFETQPLLSKYKDRMEVFPNFFSAFAGSIHARFATFTSLYPVRDYNAFTLHSVKVKSLFEVLHERGYSCSLFYSSFFDYTGFGDFLKGRGFDDLFDANNMPGANAVENVSWGLKEETTLTAIRTQIKKYAQDRRRFFLTYVPAAPHYPYDCIPERFRKFKKSDMNDFTPVYLNELLYMDWTLASIVDQLQDSGLLDHTLVIITNDHGEMLGHDGGPIGHGWAFTPELANTPLIVMDPRHLGWHVNYTIGSQVDFLPSVLDLLNIPLPSDQLYEGHSIYHQDLRPNRRTYLNTCQQFGILDGNRIVVGDRDREGKKSAGTKATSFTISNQGTKTLFTEAPAAAPAASIKAFDDFQENLLRNYSVYCQSVCKDSVPVSRGTQPTGTALVQASHP